MIRRSYHIDPRRIEFTQQQLSIAAASVLMLIFSAFMAGYFFSPKENVAGHESFINFFEIMHDSKSMALAPARNIPTGSLPQDAASSHEKEVEKDEAPMSDAKVMSKLERKSEPKQYYAQLVRFGTLEAAQSCKEKLKRTSIESLVVKKESKTSHGISYFWYQVQLEPHNKEKALELVKRAKTVLGLKECALIEHTNEEGKEIL